MNKNERSEEPLITGVQAAPDSSGRSRMVKRYKVTISGESYFLVSDEPEEHVRAIARFVDAQMAALKLLGHSDDPQRLAVLVALQCTSKMEISGALVEAYQRQVEKLITAISDEIVVQELS